MDKKKLQESIMTAVKKSLNEALCNEYGDNSDFHVFLDGMHKNIIGSYDNFCDKPENMIPGLRVIEQGLEKMFKFEYSENDEMLKNIIDCAENAGYGEHFMETVTKNSKEALKRYKKSFICKEYIVASTCGWPCKITATYEGWRTEFGYDGDHEEKVEGNSPEDNFLLAYNWASTHYGKLITKSQYEALNSDRVKAIAQCIDDIAKKK